MKKEEQTGISAETLGDQCSIKERKNDHSVNPYPSKTNWSWKNWKRKSVNGYGLTENFVSIF